MASEWPLFPLDSLVDDILDRRGVTVRKLGADFAPSGHRVISAKLVKSGTIDLSADEPRFVDEHVYRRWMRTPLMADDVILTSEAPLGEVAYVREELDWCLGQRLFAIRTDKQRLDGRFLYYALQSAGVRRDLLSRATGTTAEGVRQSELRRVRIPVPPLPEQKRIAKMLGALDDKIDLNRRMSQTLEAMARALFDASFAHEESRLPLGSMVESVRKQMRPFDHPDLVFDHYSIPAFDDSQTPRSEFGNQIKSAKWTVEQDSVLLSKLNPEIERVWLPDLSPVVEAVCSTEFLVLRPVPPTTRAFAYCLLRSGAFREQLQSVVTGTTGSRQRAHADAILALLVVAASESTVRSFDRAVAPMLDRANQMRREIRGLGSVRDLLLPRLMSDPSRFGPAELRASGSA